MYVTKHFTLTFSNEFKTFMILQNNNSKNFSSQSFGMHNYIKNNK